MYVNHIGGATGPLQVLAQLRRESERSGPYRSRSMARDILVTRDVELSVLVPQTSHLGSESGSPLVFYQRPDG